MTRGNTALLVAHPGHELRLHRWVAIRKPWVFVLTDGSGGSGKARIHGTTHLLRAVGARPGPIYAAWSDRRADQAVLDRETHVFERTASKLAETLCAQGVEELAFDAAEGYNPMHDVCHLIGETAARLAATARGRAVRTYEFPLAGAPETTGRRAEVTLQLSEAELAAKLRDGLSYPGLRDEVEGALREFGASAYRTERLYPARRGFLEPQRDGSLPHYERVGRNRVASGRYARPLLFEAHLRPLVAALDGLEP